MYPMKMQPVPKDYLWGGAKLKTIFGKSGASTVMAESWELSCCQDGLTYISNGAYKGSTLLNILEKYPVYVGESDINEFPILIKLIDAKANLSIQVHPSDTTAKAELGEQGKAEMWYIIDAEKGSYIYYGINKDVSRAEFEEKIKDGSICEVLNKVYVNKGDLFYILPGTIHAIGAGCLIAEVQQSSNTTFRVYDYDRIDSNGNKRDLQIERALEVTNLTPIIPDNEKNCDAISTNDFIKTDIFNCEHFKVAKIETKTSISLNSVRQTFQSLLFIEGEGIISHKGNTYEFKAGDSYFMPAGIGTYSIEGKATILLSSL
ncbi:MAG: type I phosphomannose isomerase catalytic subunit [Filifactoraceae bacterium]